MDRESEEGEEGTDFDSFGDRPTREGARIEFCRRL